MDGNIRICRNLLFAAVDAKMSVSLRGECGVRLAILSAKHPLLSDIVDLARMRESRLHAPLDAKGTRQWNNAHAIPRVAGRIVARSLITHASR